MIEFKGSHFERDVILWAVCWYAVYPTSYRQLEEMMEGHGVEVDHATLSRWMLKYVPLLDQEFRARKYPVGPIAIPFGGQEDPPGFLSRLLPLMHPLPTDLTWSPLQKFYNQRQIVRQNRMIDRRSVSALHRARLSRSASCNRSVRQTTISATYSLSARTRLQRSSLVPAAVRHLPSSPKTTGVASLPQRGPPSTPLNPTQPGSVASFGNSSGIQPLVKDKFSNLLSLRNQSRTFCSGMTYR
jgi:hypothetical protein